MTRFFILINFLLIIVLNVNSQLSIQPIDQIPIVGWYGVTPAQTSVARFLEQKQSGITHNFTFYSSAEQVVKALDSAKVVGIKIIINCPELHKTPLLIVKRFMNHPALAGYYVYDEPDGTLFTELGKLVNQIRSIDNKHFCYINLFPNYVLPKVLAADTYRDYLRSFIKEVPVQFLSFDHYPIIVDKFKNRSLRPEWYENLEIFSTEAQKAGKFFWAFALTTAHLNCPIPTLAEIRLQVFTNLAYGAQGIQYFTYWTPEGDIHKNLNFHNGPIDNVSKQKTEVYDYIQSVNKDIKNLSYVFLGAKVVSIAHTGEKIPKGTRRLIKLPNSIKNLETEGEGATVSILKNKNNSYIVIVNRDFLYPMKVRIKGVFSLIKILKDGTSAPVSMDTVESVDPGDMIIFSWKR